MTYAPGIPPESEQLLTDHFPTNTNKHVAQLTGLTERRVLYFSKKLGLKKSPEYLDQIKGKMRPELAKRLVALFPNNTNQHIADVLGLTLIQVTHYAKTYGLKKTAKHLYLIRSLLSKEDLEVLKQLYPDHKNKHIAEIMGLTTQQVLSLGMHNGLRKRRVEGGGA